METFSNQFVSTLLVVFCADTEGVGLKCRSEAGERGEQDREPTGHDSAVFYADFAPKYVHIITLAPALSKDAR
jgi:hypothetical protein